MTFVKGQRAPGAGRKPGSINKATSEIKSIAQQHGPTVIARLVDIANNSDNEQAVISAAKELLDRAYGKAPQSMENNHTGEIKIVVIRDAPVPVIDDDDD